ncbi:MAG: glycosyltransferase family 2 protein [Akkermansia sp.]
MITSTLPTLSPHITIIIPAYNEEATIVGVIEDFFEHCPEADIVVVDNNSTDRTYDLAKETYQRLHCKGYLLQEPRQGKGMAVRKAFSEINSDIYVMVDADLTYPAADLHQLLQPVLEGKADMVCGNRHSDGIYSQENKRPMHDFGNKLMRNMINFLFHGQLQDILTGYRVFNARFVKNNPILSHGFEIETEISIHALDKGYRIVELPIAYQDRPEGSESKLNTVKDGIKVIKTVLSVFINYRPMLFFSICGLFFGGLGLILGSIPVVEFIHTSYITHLPLTILSSGLLILSMLSFVSAVILNGLMVAQRYNHSLALLHWDELHPLYNSKK